MITPVKYDKYGSSIELKKLMTKVNTDDQDNIRFLNMQGELNTLKEKVSDYKMELKNAKAWIEQVSKSEAIHANTVIRLNQEFKEFKTLTDEAHKRIDELFTSRKEANNRELQLIEWKAMMMDEITKIYESMVLIEPNLDTSNKIN